MCCTRNSQGGAQRGLLGSLDTLRLLQVRLLCRSSLITALKRMITTGQLAFYATEKDLYDEEGDPLGVIPLSSIQRVFTSADPKPHQGHGFEVFVIQNETQRSRGTETNIYVSRLRLKSLVRVELLTRSLCSKLGRWTKRKIG